MKPLLAALLVCWSVLAWGQTAGKVDLVDGEVKIIDAAKNTRIPKLGDALSVGESVVTGADGELHLAMEDGGQMAVRPNTRMTVDRYKAEGGTDDRSVISLVQGALRSVTGWIGKFQPKNYQIRTPTATIGVRGTDHETHVIPPDNKDGEAGTYDKVNAGSTLLRTAHGTTEVRPNQAGFASFSGKKKPAVLRSVPGFFRPTKHENRFVGLHEKVHKELKQRRDERIRNVKEKRTLDKARPEHKLDQRNDRMKQREQRLQQNEARRTAGDAGASSERRHQFQERRLQREREVASRHEGSAPARGRMKAEKQGDFEAAHRPQAERRHQPASEHRRH